MKVVAIIQARMGSTRLPDKMLMQLFDRPVIAWTVERVLLSQRVHSVVVATSQSKEDDPLVEWCSNNGTLVFRGSTEDVLDRYYQCALTYQAVYIVRVTGDSPLITPQLIDLVVEACLADNQVDYASNVEPMTYPEGMGVEVVPFQTLEVAWRESHLPSHREHVTPFIRFHPEKFKHAVLKAEPELSHIRLTIDYEQDLIALTKLLKILRKRGFVLDFTLDDIISVLNEEPSIMSSLASKRRDLWRQEVAQDEGRAII